MKLSKQEMGGARQHLHKIGLCFVTAALASMMVTPVAFANSSGTGVVTSNGYGMNPSSEIGENTVPNLTRGDQPYVLTDLYNTSGQRYITGCCGGSGTASCDYLDVVGVDNVGSAGYNWGTKININPDHFAWNDAVTDESTCSQVGGDATSSGSGIGYVKDAWSGVMTYATVEKYLPDVLACTTPDTYKTIVEMINKDGLNDDGSVANQKYVDYDPQIINLSASRNLAITTLVDALWTEAAAAKAVDGYGDTAITRYGDPEEIAQDFEGFVKGLQWYILSKHEKQGTLKTVAHVTGYADGQITITATNPARTMDGKTSVRSYEGYDQITNNIAFTGETFTRTEALTDNDVNTYTSTSFDDFKNVDVVFISSGGQGGGQGGGTSVDAEAFQAALEAAATDGGWKAPKVVTPSLAITNQGFGLIRNQVEYMGYLYPDDVQLSYALKYFWSHFGHVKDEYIDAVMVDQDSTKLLPTGDAEIDLDTTGYSESYILSRVVAGEAYYLENKTNTSSACSHYVLQAQGTVEANNYQYGAAAKMLNESLVSVKVPTAKTGLKYNGKTQTGVAGGTGYTVTGGTAKTAGTHTAKVTLKTGYKWSDGTTAAKTVKFTIAKASQSVKASTATKSVKAKKVAKKAQKTSKVKVTGAKTSVTYTKKSGSKKLTINKKTGKITVKKGTKKGTYKIKVTVKAAKSTNYNAASKTVTIKVKVK